MEHSYEYDGDRLVYEHTSNTSLRFIYDERGLLASLLYNTNGTWSRYHYVRDITLNIFGLTDDAGNLVVRYTYDAWGNVLSITGSMASTIGVLNPFRYKGYYFDSETGMYYCQTRYYVPQWCRWLSADCPKYLDVDSPEGINLFAYCLNNPTMLSDSSGHSPWSDFWNSTDGKNLGSALAIVGMIFLSIATAGAGTGVVAALGGGFWAAVAGGAVGGAISGAIFGAGLSIVNQGITNGYSNIDWGKVGIDTAIGFGTGALTGALFAAAGRGLGLLGRTKWAQRPLANYSKTSTNFLFGSDKSFTFLRFGQNFRLDASMKIGLHFHGIVSSAEHWVSIFQIGNTLAGLIPSIIYQFSD